VVGAVLDELEQRDTERQRLARSGPRLPDDVLAAQRQREGERLDGEGGEDARGRQARADRVADAEITEQDRPYRVFVFSLSCQGFPSFIVALSLPRFGPVVSQVARRDAGCYLAAASPRQMAQRRTPGSPLPSPGLCRLPECCLPGPPGDAAVRYGGNSSHLFKHDLWLHHSVGWSQPVYIQAI
jgi:hypothetical protein